MIGWFRYDKYVYSRFAKVSQSEVGHAGKQSLDTTLIQERVANLATYSLNLAAFQHG